jgi:hypothetical protein
MNIYTSVDGTKINQGTPFVIGGVAYPANWLQLASTADLTAAGITVTTVADPPPPPPPPITSVTPRQARLALNAAGLLAQVNAAVAVADQATQITWEFATQIDRNDPLIATLATGLNLSSVQVDALFAQAATL